MAIIRMSYISDLPTPDEIIKKIEEDNLSLTEKKFLILKFLTHQAILQLHL